ncbi:MAG: NAD(P)H-dependent glycerol-3-phosphate dehydrogenase [Pseudomonadales bacterium]|nr:NAD(P)H-dependent glycerol-3-phosphate dehydrogenase [Pseudomonadales bacterium]MCP5185657.1 NAD(P)H-dependent glycerol-3-phosphate dehydrogenase [Pseudomonadales bacterium]
MSRIAVLGLGNFGTALARNWLLAGHSVCGWTVEQEVFDTLSASEENTKYLPGVRMPGMTVTMDLAASVRDAEVVILALPSGVVLSVVDQLVSHLRDEQVLVDLAKGLAEGDRLISDVIEEKLAAAGRRNELCVMMGPTIAPELARGVYTTALVASRHATTAARMAALLTTATLKLAPASDPLGAEYWGAFKNVIALACGVADGLKESGLGGDNLKAAIFTAGYREAVGLLPKLGADAATALTAAGIGDLFVTATSPHGRNREMGERLGRGQTLQQAQGQMVMVSEGVRAARMFRDVCARGGHAAPFVGAVCGLLDGDLTVAQFLDAVTSA